MYKLVVFAFCLMSAACGEEHYKVRGIYIFPHNGQPTKACMKEAINWLEYEYSCWPDRPNIKSIAKIIWKGEPFMVRSAGCNDNPNEITECKAAGRIRTGISKSYDIFLVYYPDINDSALVHEWHHIAMDVGNEPTAPWRDPTHIDPSWRCVEDTYMPLKNCQ